MMPVPDTGVTLRHVIGCTIAVLIVGMLAGFFLARAFKGYSWRSPIVKTETKK